MSWFSRTALSLIILTTVVGSTTGVVFAQSTITIGSDAAAAKDDRKNNRNKIIAELGLTPQQIRQIRAVRRQFKGQRRSLRRSLAAAERDLARLIVGNAADDRVQRKRNEIRNLQQKLDVVRAKNRDAFRQILTAQQWQKLQEIRSRRRGR